MADNFAIERLGSHQWSDLQALNALFALAFDDQQSYGSAPPSRAYLEGLLAGQSFIALIARDGAVVVGGLTAYVLDKFEQERREIYIYDLAVLPEFRRRGVATALLRALRAEAADRGAYVVFVQADLDDAPAIALYAKHGTREDVLHFDIAPARIKTIMPRRPSD